MKNLLLLLFTIFSFTQESSSQNILFDNGLLVDYLSNKEIVKREKISDYLKRFPAINSDSLSFYIHDIIDGKIVIRSSDNRSAGLASKTNKLYPGGSLNLNLTGQGMSVGVWDGGWILSTHQEFLENSVTRVTQPDNEFGSITTDSHGTHVGGTIGAKGVNTNARGMAPNVNILSYNWTSDETEVVNEAANGLLVSNHSYGIPILNDNGSQNAPTWMMGCYNSDARDWDLIARNNPYYLSVHSAGNSGMDSYSGGFANGLDKLTANKNAKNILIVANANPSVHPVTGNITDLSINPSSSQGPTDDGRIKPDIAADGTSLFSTYNTSNVSYDTLSGTSMASPVVSGSLILLQQHYNDLYSNFMTAASLKGVVCHTALDDLSFIGPDPRFGWGLLDTSAAATVITNANSNQPTAILNELVMNQSGTYTIQVNVTNPQLLKATICWTDVAGVARNNQLNSTTPVLVNDLDLRIIKESDTFFPWKFDMTNIMTTPAIKGDNTVDNVEKVEVENASGIYTIQVTHKGTLSGGSQNYSLIVSGFDQANLSNNDLSKGNIAVYPNPVGDVLFVTSDTNHFTGYELFDIQGRLIKKENVYNLNSFEIGTSSLTKGMYILNLTSESGSFTQKVVKK